MSPRDLLRVVAGAMALTLGPGLLSASCSDHHSGTIAPGHVDVGDDASVDAHVSATPTTTCTPPADAIAQCAGSNASLTFYPALQCATPHDAGTDDASDAGDAAAAKDPCSGISPDDTFFTPTACSAFAKAEASGLVTTAAAAPSWSTPGNGDLLTADEWAIFAWLKPSTAQRGPLNDVLDFMEPSAHAFTPLGGDAYVVEFTVDCVEILRVALSVTAWTPDRASWAILVAQTKPITARVIAMKFVDDALAPGTAPTMSAPITFSIAH